MAKKETTPEKKTKTAAPKTVAAKPKVAKAKVEKPVKAEPADKIKKTVAKKAAPKAAVEKPAAKAKVVKATAAKADKPVAKAKAVKEDKPAAKKATATKAKAAKPAKVAAPVDPDQELLDTIVDGILDKKGHNILVLDLRPTGNTMADWFVICHGNSNTQADAIADSVEDTVRKKLNSKPWHTEGFQNAEWILLDYVNVVVHVFQEHIREFYRLEDLWADAPTVKIEESFVK